MLKLPKVIGHRGAKGYAPENTLESIRTAADMGVEWVELDVKLTRDGVPVIFHDEDLARVTNGSGLMAETDYEDVKDLDAGSWYGESFLGAKIPTLEETASVALDVMSQIWDDHDKILISSFKLISLEAAQNLANDWARGLLLDEEIPEDWPKLAEHLQVSTINLNGNSLKKSECEYLLEAELPLLAYTINDPMRARELQRWGIDSIFSDVPDLIIENLLESH